MIIDKGMTRSEIEKVSNSKGEFVQIDYISRMIKEEFPSDIKKFLYVKLADIYERKGMFKDAAKIYDTLAIQAIAFSEKIKNYVKEAELYVKAGAFDSAEYAMKKSFNDANALERQDIYRTIKNFYKKQAEVYEKELRRGHAVKVYEKLLEMNMTEAERIEIKEKLLKLYEKLGKLKEYKALKGR